MVSNDILMLKIIDSNARLSLLIDRGLTYAQIATMLQSQMDAGLVEIKDDYLCLTESGKKSLEENFKKLNISKKESWILPQDCYYKKPKSSKEIFLPRKI